MPEGRTKAAEGAASWRWFLVTLALSCVTILAVVFSLWELIEHRYFRDLDYTTLHYLYITRGVASSLLVGMWATWFVLRERRRREAQLERSYEHYRALLNNMPEAVVLFDESFRVLEWNQAAARLFGFDREQVLGQTLPTVSPERFEELQQLVEGVGKGQAVLDHETERCTARGERIPVAVSYSCLQPTGNHRQLFLEVAQDIRPRLRMRDKLLELEKLTLMGQMATGTAHHLNTPLTAMLLQLQMLRQQARSLEKSPELAVIERQIHFCQAFVQSVLRFARRPQLEQNPTPLGEVIEGVITLLRPTLTLKRANLEVHLDGLRHCRVLGDRNHLEVMFSALVSNAVDAIPPDGRIGIEGSAASDGQVEICIEDDGPGIPDNLWPRLFEPFLTTKPAGQGTGLGLAIARSIAEGHGGTLRLQNRPGRGLRAVVQLPYLEEGRRIPAVA